MAYNSVPTVATGDLWTAANHNAYIRDNINLLGSGSEGVALVMRSGAPAYAGVIAARLGGDTDHWDVFGTTEYVPSKAIMQTGVVRWTGAANITGFVTVTFPTAFSKRPVIFSQPYTSATRMAVHIASPVSESGFTLWWRNVLDASEFTSLDFFWLAIGPID